MKGAIFCNGVYYGGDKGDPGVGISEIVDNGNGTLSIFLTDGSEYTYRIQNIPVPTIEDEGKFLRVDSSGKWAIEDVPIAEESSF